MRAVRRFLGRETVAAGTVAQAAVASVPAPGDALLDAAQITEEA